MLELTYTYTCAVCGNKQEVKHSMYFGTEPPKPCIPAGWHMFDGGILCDKHVLKIINKDGDTDA